MLQTPFRVQRARHIKQPHEPMSCQDNTPKTPNRLTNNTFNFNLQTPPALERTTVTVTPPSKKTKNSDCPERSHEVVSRTSKAWRRIKQTNLIQKLVKYQEWRVVLPGHMSCLTRPSFYTLQAAIDFCCTLHGNELTATVNSCSEEQLGTLDLDNMLEACNPEIDLDFEALFDDNAFSSALEDIDSLRHASRGSRVVVPIDTTSDVTDMTNKSKFRLRIVPTGVSLRPQNSRLASTAVACVGPRMKLYKFGSVDKTTIHKINKSLSVFSRPDNRLKRRFNANTAFTAPLAEKTENALTDDWECHETFEDIESGRI